MAFRPIFGGYCCLTITRVITHSAVVNIQVQAALEGLPPPVGGAESHLGLEAFFLFLPPTRWKRELQPTNALVYALRSPPASTGIGTSAYLHSKFSRNGVSVSYELFSHFLCDFNLEVTSFLPFMDTCSLSAVCFGGVRDAVNDKQEIPPTRLTSSVLHI